MKNNIYFDTQKWKLISMSTGVLSILIVLPHLAENKLLFGLYSFCISLSAYLNYADLGFFSAGQKYAAEEYVKGSREAEYRILGFSVLLLLVLITPFTILLTYLSFNTKLIWPYLTTRQNEIASVILLTAASILPFQLIFQRIGQFILAIRIMESQLLKIEVISNIIKIISIYYFFTDNNYKIGEYYIFINIVGVLSALVTLLFISRRLNYNWFLVVKAIRFNKDIYVRLKQLARVSFLMTLSWLLLYELDLVFVGLFYPPQDLAIFSIGFTFINFYRSFWNAVYAPYQHVFNHLTALVIPGKRLSKLLIKLVHGYFPLVFCSLLILLAVMNLLIPLWVGEHYLDAVLIIKLLLISSFLTFVNQPISYYLIATEELTFLKKIAIIQPIIYVAFLSCTTVFQNINFFAFSKFLVAYIIFGLNFKFIWKETMLNLLFRRWWLQVLSASMFSYFLHIIMKNYIFTFSFLEKSPIHLVLLLLVVAVFYFAMVFVFYSTDKIYGKYIGLRYNKWRNRGSVLCLLRRIN